MSTRGFTLIEVTIAVFLIGFLAVLAGSISTAAPLARHVKLENVALVIAADKIEELRALGYADLPASGSFSHTSLSTLPSGTGEYTVSTYNSRTKQVVVTVTWVEAGAIATTSASLTTLVTEIGGLP
jgi:prepilin-type N-terminal cleavage/methylation domain-containing protein